MRFPRSPIRAILFAVVLMAADCAALRVLVGGTAPFRLVLGLFGTLPMSNILAIACYGNATRRAGPRPFFLGFGATGAAAVLAYWIPRLVVREETLLSILSRSARASENLAVVKESGRGSGRDPPG